MARVAGTTYTIAIEVILRLTAALASAVLRCRTQNTRIAGALIAKIVVIEISCASAI